MALQYGVTLSLSKGWLSRRMSRGRPRLDPERACVSGLPLEALCHPEPVEGMAS
jgi:hypothetical protein